VTNKLTSRQLLKAQDNGAVIVSRLYGAEVTYEPRHRGDLTPWIEIGPGPGGRARFRAQDVKVKEQG